MSSNSPTSAEPPTETAEHYLPKDQFQRLLDQLHSLGYEVVGPTIDQEAIVYDAIERVEQLPQGWTDQQSAGRYQLVRRDDQSLFGYVVGPHSWKKYLFPPEVPVMLSRRTDQGWQMQDASPPAKRFALLGVRACELSAIAIQDKVFLNPDYPDPIYAARRQQLFIVAVNCTQAASTCFCTSMQTGPQCRTGFDIALTELPEGFVVCVSSSNGRSLVQSLQLPLASNQQSQDAAVCRSQAEQQVTKRLRTENIHDDLLNNLEHPEWSQVAERCLSCANCTMVCPTCFCSSVDDVTDLTDDSVLRQRRWDSCFNVDISHMSGGPVRDTTRSRYRQWVTHKMATWIDQFGSSGCVGCGRCITWCPVGIDITEEVAKICDEVPT